MFFSFRSEAEKRKTRSVRILNKHGVPYIEHLPVISDHRSVCLKRKEEIAKRLLACMIAIQVACELRDGDNEASASRAFFREQLSAYSVQDCLTACEKEMFDGTPTTQNVVDMIWKYERCWVLLWALGFVKELQYPSSLCDCTQAIRLVTSHRDFAAFCGAAKMRSVHEILDEADLIYRYDWACSDARIHGRIQPANLDPGVVMERHMALNWLIGEECAEDWDSISVDT